AKGRLPPPVVTVGGDHFEVPVAIATSSAKTAERPAPAVEPYEGETVLIPLVRLAFARSGDKGDSANIGVIPRAPAFTPVLRLELTADRVRDYFAHLVEGPVHRFEVPGVGGFNFLLERALAGGGMASLRNDPLGKGFAQMLLDMPVAVPAEMAEQMLQSSAERR
ncbi:hypothetical protein AB4144_37985, partial [Rhizobiaceae sp. 2RAB30]